MPTHRIAAWILGAGLCGFVAGCAGSSAKPQPTGNSPPATASLSPEQAKGRAVYEKFECGNCHMIGGQTVGGKKGTGGPDLGTVGANSTHTAAWLADHVKDPTVHKPKSKMPKYAGKISDEDLKSLSEYLASLK